jgi:hypothetical protein
MDQKDQISPKDQEPAHCELISRRRFLIYLGILFGSIIAGLSLLRNLGIKTINRFRINSIDQTPVFDPSTWTLAIDGLVETEHFMVLSFGTWMKSEYRKIFQIGLKGIARKKIYPN